MKQKGILKTSLLLNVVLIIGLGAFAFHKREKITEKVETFLVKYHSSEERDSAELKYRSPREEALANFNNEPLEAVNDSLMIGVDSTITCLFLGNSLTYTGVPDEEPDKEKRGLTSTSKEKDYVHVLLKTIAENRHLNIKYSILNIAQFERTFTRHSFSMDKLQFASVLQPDFLFVQIGENVAKDDIIDPKKFEDEYVRLLGLFPDSKKIITIPFWPDKDKEYAITNVAIRSNSFLVDISHLGDGTDKNNFSSSYKDYKKPGVGAHPGDYGMAHIAECLYAAFNSIFMNL